MAISRKSKWTIIAIGTIVVLSAAFVLWPFKFWSYSLCSKCGEIEHSTEWQLPSTFITFWTYSSTEPSRSLISSGLVSVHNHDWQFGHGGGNGVRCALGTADRLYSVVTSSNVSMFLDLTRRYGGPDETATYLAYTFDPDLSRAVLLLAGILPEKGIHSTNEFRRWMEEYHFIVDDELEEAKRR